ncbi:MAG: hypothetical protein LBU37_08095 [Tannerellaceae bacterium]|nr:hypothetical protein [Tannerellaceae bacterium]
MEYILNKDIKRLASLGLYNGEFGVFLYLSLYNKVFPDAIIENINSTYTEQIIQQWSDYPDNHTYCSGTSGILDMLYYLEEKNIYHIDLTEAIDYMENSIANKMIQDISEGNYDFLHGALGPASYLLNRNSKLDYVENFIYLLYKYSAKGNGMHKWPFFDEIGGNKTYNISLSHGISSIVLFLTEAYRKNIAIEKVTELLFGSISYILDQKFDSVTDNLSMFPSFSKENDTMPSRLGWCYGDLRIAVALWKAGESLKQDDYKKWAIRIVENALSRINLASNLVYDAGICHGTTGIAIIFQHYWEEMKLDKILTIRDYWIHETVKMIPFVNHQKLELSQWCLNSYNLLMGISGIGLVLLSFITRDFSWKRLFLLR